MFTFVTSNYKHQLRKDYYNDNEDKWKEMTFKDQRLDTEKNLQHTSKTKPSAKKGFQQQNLLKVTQPLFGNRAKIVVKKHGTGKHGNDKRLWNNLAHILHKLLTRLWILLSQILFHTRAEKIVCKQKAAIDKNGKDVDKMHCKIYHKKPCIKNSMEL